MKGISHKCLIVPHLGSFRKSLWLNGLTTRVYTPSYLRCDIL
jgi:hypothetical protein